jgi:hypothetical protein
MKFSRGDNSERVKITEHFLKIIFSKTTEPKVNQTRYKSTSGKGNSSCPNKGPGPFQTGDNHKNVKKGWGHLKIFSRNTGPILSRLCINHPWGRNSSLFK